MAGKALEISGLQSGCAKESLLDIDHESLESCQRIAAAGGGQYFELDRDPDRDIANKIIDAGRRQSPATTKEGTIEELYWRFLAAALGLAALGSLFLRERTELWIQLGATLATGVAIWSLIAV